MKRCAFIFIGMILTGCAHFKAQPLSAEKTAAQLESRRLDDAGLKLFLEKNLGREMKTWPLEKWDLRELTLAAFYFHPSLEVARAQWLVAAGGIKTAGARLNPSVSFDPSYDTQIPGNYSPWLVPVTFDVPIETAGKRGKRVAEAEKVAEAARWDFVSAAWKIRSEVRTRLQEFTIAGERARLLGEQLAAQQKIGRLLQQRFEVGEIARPEFTVAQIGLNKTQLELNDAEAAQAEARSRLAEALGLSEAAVRGLDFHFELAKRDVSELTSADARRAALRSRADILGALADYAAAEAELRLQIAKQYPDLHLGPGYAFNNGNAGDNEWILGISLELPILDQNQGPIAEAEAKRKLSAAKFKELQARVIGEIDRAVAGWGVADKQLKNSEAMVVIEQQQREAIAAQFNSGAADSLDSVTAEMEFTTATLARLDAEGKLQVSFGELEDALQLPADAIAMTIEKLAAKNPNE
jgi:outer membrane protein, heavy metal efflux system